MKRERVETITIVLMALLMGVLYGGIAFVVFAYTNAALAGLVVLMMVTVGILLAFVD